VAIQYQISIDVGVVLTIIASALMFWLSSRNSAVSQKQEHRRRLAINHLVESYRKLEAACNRPQNSPQFKELESALANIQLFGSTQQIALAHEFMENFSPSGGNLEALLNQLRDELREEIELDATKSKMKFFRAK
jgi:hypothetical protein